METPRKFIIAELSIRKLGSSSVLIIISTDEDPSLRIESFAIVNLRGVSIKFYFNLIFERAYLFFTCFLQTFQSQQRENMEFLEEERKGLEETTFELEKLVSTIGVNVYLNFCTIFQLL